MRILLVTQYFWPENFIINDVVRLLSGQGHEVVVATGKPNYPEGTIFEGYNAWSVNRDTYLDSVEVIRVPLWPRGTGGSRNLILNYLSFVFLGFVFFPYLLRKRKFDVVFVFAPSPLLQSIPAIFIKYIKKIKLVLWVQDLWPESLAATGYVKNKIVLRFVGFVVRWIYSCSDMILVQSKSFIDAVSTYADRQKIVYYPNSIDVSQKYNELNISDELRVLLNNYFCIVFAGNLGSAQGLETVVRAAESLREQTDIRIVLVGSGSRSNWLQAKIDELNLDNLILAGRFPPQVMPKIYELSSGLLVLLGDSPIFERTVPSKIQSYLAAGRPIIASLNGEGANVILEARAGLCSASEKVDPLVKNILALKAMNDSERRQMGQNGLKYFYENFEMNKKVNELVGLLDSL